MLVLLPLHWLLLYNRLHPLLLLCKLLHIQFLFGFDLLLIHSMSKYKVKFLQLLQKLHLHHKHHCNLRLLQLLLLLILLVLLLLQSLLLYILLHPLRLLCKLLHIQILFGFVQLLIRSMSKYKVQFLQLLLMLHHHHKHHYMMHLLLL